MAGWRGTQGKAVKYVPLWVSLSLMLGCSGRCEYSEPQIPAADYAVANSPRVPAPPVVVTTAASYAYPLKVAANGRYLIDQNNKPFRIQGDSAQSLIANLTYAEAVTYLTDRQAKGFNTVNINLLEHKFAVDAPANRNGDVVVRFIPRGAQTFRAYSRLMERLHLHASVVVGERNVGIEAVDSL